MANKDPKYLAHPARPSSLPTLPMAGIIGARHPKPKRSPTDHGQPLGAGISWQYLHLRQRWNPLGIERPGRRIYRRRALDHRRQHPRLPPRAGPRQTVRDARQRPGERLHNRKTRPEEADLPGALDDRRPVCRLRRAQPGNPRRNAPLHSPGVRRRKP